MAVDRNFLGKGWRFPVAVNLTGGIATSSFEENVRESVFVIIGTAQGERVNRPEFGCRIHDLMFAPNTPLTAARAAHFVEEALWQWERRVEDLKVTAVPNPDEPNRLDITVRYRIVGKADEKNLVYPFYMRQPDEQA
jgi:phage baseplate assembly protein W